MTLAQMVSMKFYSGYDEDVSISEWAQFGNNLAVERLKALEIELLDAMDWKIYVSHETFYKKLKQIEQELAVRETRSRGWLTYTELCTLMPSIDAVRKALAYSVLLAVSYTAGVCALAGAFFVASQVPGSYLCDRAQPTSVESLSTAVNEAGPDSALASAEDGGNFSEQGLTELEQRLILNGVEWEPVSSADEDGRRIHLNAGTDYWTVAEAGAYNMAMATAADDELRRIGVESLAHGSIRKRENDTDQHRDFAEWQPFQSNHHDLSFLSYLWLKFL